MPLNPSVEKPLIWEDQEELNFPDLCTFVHHVELASREVYNSVMRLQKHLMLVDKQNQKLKSKFTNYEKTNKAYVIDNIQLKAKNDNLENQLANLEKQLKIAHLDKCLTPSSLPLPPLLIFDDSDGDSKYSHYHSQKAKLTKLPDPPMLTDGHAVKFDINVWKSKMAKKLTTNIDHYPTKVLRMAYVNSCMDKEAYKNLAARSKISTRKLFAIAKEMFEVL